MAAKTVLNYIPRESIIHQLCGTTKLIIFLVFSLVSIITYDIRVIALILVYAITCFFLSKIRFKEVKTMFGFILAFLIVNYLCVYFFSPNYGCELYGSKTVLFHLFGKYDITKEQLFYQLNISSKYFIALPLAILFITTTNPSELAASLNGIGIPYKIAYAFSLALRYIPDVQKDFHDISQAQQARGIELGKDSNVIQRLKNTVNILLPLILSSISRIDQVSNAMDLRSFGKSNKRSWYMKKDFKKLDAIALLLSLVIAAFCLVVTYSNGSRYFNPFI